MLTLGDILYLVNDREISTFNISDSKNPKKLDSQTVGFAIESLIHYEGLLLIGSASNMYIYEIQSNGIPKRKSVTRYFGADQSVCASDPIVVRNQLAYVTLSQFNDVVNCRQVISNELRVYDISNLNQPKLLTRLGLKGPKGLALGKNNLYVCDGKGGLAIIDITDPTKPKLKLRLEGFNAFDAIVKGNLLIISAEKQLVQYDITDENNIKWLGKIDL